MAPDHVAPEAAKPALAGCGSRLGWVGTILDQAASTMDTAYANSADGER